MGTFSINIGQITEATAYSLNDQTYFNNILDTLKDNEDKLIDPKDLRDAILSIWSSIPFKQTSIYSTTSYNNSYIGIDSSNPSDRDYKKTIFIGKRSYSGTYSYLPLHDIMSSSLLGSDVDIFLFNTKIDTVSNTITRASILAGKNKNLYNASPFIQSQLISRSTNLQIDDFNMLNIDFGSGFEPTSGFYNNRASKIYKFNNNYYITSNTLYDGNDGGLIKLNIDGSYVTGVTTSNTEFYSDEFNNNSTQLNDGSIILVTNTGKVLKYNSNLILDNTFNSSGTAFNTTVNSQQLISYGIIKNSEENRFIIHYGNNNLTYNDIDISFPNSLGGRFLTINENGQYISHQQKINVERILRLKNNDLLFFNFGTTNKSSERLGSINWTLAINNSVNVVEMDNSDICFVGDFTTSGSLNVWSELFNTPSFGLAILKSDGTGLRTNNEGEGFDSIFFIHRIFQHNGKIYINTVDDTVYNNQTLTYLARINEDLTLDEDFFIDMYSSTYREIDDIYFEDDYMILVGNFNNVNGQICSGIVYLDYDGNPINMLPDTLNNLLEFENTVSIDFISKSGQLDIINGYIYSTQSTTIINNLTFPSIEYASTSALDSTTFFWRGSTTSGTLSLEEITLPITNTVGTSSESIEIFGSPVNVNGYSLELDDSRLMPISLGGISLGTSFSNYPIVEVLRRIIYPYLPPLCSISIDRMYVEVGTLPIPILTYSIIKRTNKTGPISLLNMNPGDLPPITVDEFTTINGIAQGIIPTTTGEIGTTPINYTILVPEFNNIVVASASTFIKGIYPYFYGITNTTSALLFQNLIKLEENISDKILSISGNGTFYFAYDADYPDLSQILDQFGNNIISNFSQSIVIKASPQGYWNNKDYKIYQWVTPSLIYPTNYQFRY